MRAPMMRPRSGPPTLGRRLAAGALGLAVALGAGACTGSSEPSAEEAPTESPSPSAPAGESPAPSLPPQPLISVDPNAPGADTTYCRLLATDLANLFAGIQGPDDVDQAVGLVEQLADEAPEQVAGEWRLISGALEDLEGALRELADLEAKVRSGEVPQQRLERETRRLMEDMTALDTERNRQAGDRVVEHATEYCGMDLGATP